MRVRLLPVLLLPMMLGSCYFNSTASLYDKAEYEARVNTADLNAAAQPVVYQNGANYYIELPRCRYGTPLRMQHSLFEQSVPEPACAEARGTGMYLIPKDFALYLTGQGPAVTRVSGMKEVPDAEEIKMLSRPIPVVKPAGENVVNYTYESPNAMWLRMVAPLNWLLVDVPVTVVENVVVVASCASVIWLFQEGGTGTATHLIIDSMTTTEEEEQ